MELNLKRHKKNRQIHLDVVCGILIIYMIFGHCSQWSHATDFAFAKIASRIFFFFMPWFFFKAGMFFKQVRAIKDVFSSKCRRLIKPFVTYTFIGHPFYCLKIYLEGCRDVLYYTWFPTKSILFSGACGANAPLWFLLSLFVVILIATAVDKFLNIKFLLLLGGGAMILNNVGFEKPFWCANICSGAFFFAMGFLLNSLQYKRKWVILSVVIYLFNIVFPSAVDMNRNILYCGWYGSWLISSVAACVMFNNISLLYCKRFHTSAFFEKIGKNSMFYYCTHWIVLLVATILLRLADINFSPFILLLYYCVSIVLFSVVWNICCSFFRHKIWKKI